MTTHKHPPPGFVTANAAAEIVGHSRQAFYQSGIADWLDSWKVGRVRLYRMADVRAIADFVEDRPGLVALGVIPANAPLIPSPDLWSAWKVGEFFTECPRCGGPALEVNVLGPIGTHDPQWCKNCGRTS